jgi:hypothetical protein
VTDAAFDTLAVYEAAAVRPSTRLYQPGLAEPDVGATTALDPFGSAPGTAPAVSYFDRTLTYGDIDRLSDHLAGWLSARGLGRGERFAFWMMTVRKNRNCGDSSDPEPRAEYNYGDDMGTTTKSKTSISHSKTHDASRL